MLEIMVRDMPQQERASFDSSRGLTATLPLSSLASTCSTSTNLSSPLGPLTEIFCPERLTVTPVGTETGFLPMRDIVQSSEYRADHFAAHILGACFRIRHDAFRRRKYGDAEAVIDGRNPVDRDIDPARRLRHAVDLVDHRRSIEIFEFDFDLGPAAVMLDGGEAADETFLLQDAKHALTQLGGRGRHFRPAALLRVAYAGQHVPDRIGKAHLPVLLLRPLTSST